MQEQIIRRVLSGRDTLALLPTGGGKSLCFQVPALAMGRLCLVISPLIALMRDQVGRLKKQGIAARAVISGMSHAEIENALDSAVAGKLAFLYVSPERLTTEHFLGRLPRMPLGVIAVDEAHCISQWGYDFRPSYLNIGKLREHVPGIPMIALTASATGTVARDICDKLGLVDHEILRGSFHRPELVLWISRGEDKQGRLLRILQKIPGTALVYVRERKGTLRLAHFLRHHGHDAQAYHAGMSGEERDGIQRSWTNGDTRIVVATNAFGMGIDKADVRCVVHMEPPPDLESYYQEAGRAGRDGKKSFAFLLTAPGDEERLRERLATSFPPLPDVRRTYQAFADMHGIALGSGQMETYPLDIRALVERTGVPLGMAVQCLKVLELDGKLSISEGLRSPSRVIITAPPSTIYQMRVGDARYGPLLETLLRAYGGLFEEPGSIDEMQLARMNSWHVDTVVSRLTELDRMDVISYRRRSDSPSVTLLVPREDAQQMKIDPVALEQRRDRALHRMEAMIAYFKESEQCRTAMLLSYFDEPDVRDCGTCDTCMRTHARYRRIHQDGALNDPLEEFSNDREYQRWQKDEKGLDDKGQGDT